MTVHVLIACYNRRETTVRAVQGVRQQAEAARIPFTVTVYDDGSRDGTADRLRSEHADIRVLEGDGAAYWAKGMAIAERTALDQGTVAADDLLWLNDDVELDSGALAELFEVRRTAPLAIIVGATRDSTGEISYSGLRRRGVHPLSFSRVEPNGETQEVETFNGNVALIPVALARDLRGIDGGFSHGLADIDYGLRARGRGYQVLLARRALGVCDRNPSPARRPVWTAWRTFLSAKGGGNARSLARHLRRHGGRLWPMVFFGTYVSWWMRTIGWRP